MKIKDLLTSPPPATGWTLDVAMAAVVRRQDKTGLRCAAVEMPDGVFEVGPNQYQAVIVAQAWSYTPAEITVPAGAEVEFVISTRDVIHGFMIPRTRVNIMLIPGRVSKVSHTFDEPGVHNIICHEFCGLGHSQMFGRVVVEQ